MQLSFSIQTFNANLSLDTPVFKTFLWIFSYDSDTKYFPEHDIYAAEHLLNLTIGYS